MSAPMPVPVPTPMPTPDAHSTATLVRPRVSAAFMLRHAAHFIALGFGSGLARRVPGTVGTVWAWLAFAGINFVWAPSAAQWGWLIAGSFLLGWWASALTTKRLALADPGAIVIDEIVAFWLVLWLVTPSGFGTQLVAFLLFRYFDAAKPAPVAWADTLFKGVGWRGGFGVMFDDVVAAFCTLVLMALWRAF